MDATFELRKIEETSVDSEKNVMIQVDDRKWRSRQLALTLRFPSSTRELPRAGY